MVEKHLNGSTGLSDGFDNRDLLDDTDTRHGELDREGELVVDHATTQVVVTERVLEYFRHLPTQYEDEAGASSRRRAVA